MARGNFINKRQKQWQNGKLKKISISIYLVLNLCCSMSPPLSSIYYPSFLNFFFFFFSFSIVMANASSLTSVNAMVAPAKPLLITHRTNLFLSGFRVTTSQKSSSSFQSLKVEVRISFVSQ